MIHLSLKSKLGVLIVALAAGVLVLVACGQKAADNKTTDDAGSDLVKRLAKIVRNDEASWPLEVPDDVPPFTEGRITSVRKAVTPGGTSWTIHLAAVEEGGFDRYFGVLKNAVWDTTVNQFETSGTCTAKKDVFTLTLTYDGNEGTLVVQMGTP